MEIRGSEYYYHPPEDAPGYHGPRRPDWAYAPAEERQPQGYPERRARHGRPPPVEELYRERRQPDPQYSDRPYSDRPYGEPPYREPPIREVPLRDQRYRERPYREAPYRDQTYQDQRYQPRPPAIRRISDDDHEWRRVPPQNSARAELQSAPRSHRSSGRKRRSPVATITAISVLVLAAGAAYGLDTAGLLPGLSKSTGTVVDPRSTLPATPASIPAPTIVPSTLGSQIPASSLPN